MKNINEINQFEELNLKQTFRAYILYEQIMGHPFNENDGLNGMIVLFFSYIMGSNRDTNIDYNEYLDWLDEHPNMLASFSAWMVRMNEARLSIAKQEPEGETKEVEQ